MSRIALALYRYCRSILGACRDNEHTNRLIVVHCSNDVEGGTIKTLSKHIEMFDTMYPKIKISLLTVTGTFNPGLIDWLSK